MLVWEPGRRLLLEWRGVNFAPGERTAIDVRFEPARGGTRVTVEHGGWDGLPHDHPVRHGQPDEAFFARLGGWWADLLRALRVHASTRS